MESTFGFIIDFAVGILAFGLPIAFLSFLTTKFGRVPFASYRWIAIAMVLLCSLYSASLGIKKERTSSSATVISREPRQEVSALSDAEKSRFGDLFRSAIRGEPDPDDSKRKEFWVLLEKARISEPDIVEKLKSSISGGSTQQFQRLFWQDVEATFKERKPVKSPERSQFEASMIASGQATRPQLDKYEETIEHVAKNEPVDMGGGKVVLDEERISKARANVEASADRFQRLLTKPE